MAIPQRSARPDVGAKLFFATLVAASFAGVFGVLFAPVLAGRATFVHGDALSVSLPLQSLLAGALAEGRIPLWSDAIYGGHPIFAEGQGGFLHPLNLLLFGVVPQLADEPGRAIGSGTLYAHGLLHWICAWLAACGTFGLCRALGLSAVASAFAGLALAASQDWLGLTSNSAIALAVSFAPLTLWALERWWRRPEPSAALGLGSSVALMALAGYPQAVHAVLIGALVMLLVRADGGFWRAPQRHLATGLLAVAVALGLSAVQLLPTLELAGESVRAGGVELAPSSSALRQLRGMLFGVDRFASADPGLGSLLVLGIAGLGLVAPGRPLARLRLGWLLASLLLFQLALADASPLYRLLRDVLPGLDRFRITHLYATVGLVGVAVLAGFGAQWLAELGTRARRPSLLRIGGVAGAVGAVALSFHYEDVSVAAWLLPLLAAVALAAAVALGRTRGLAVGVLVLLLVEIATLRPRHGLLEVAELGEPSSTAAFLLDQPRPRDFRVANLPHFFSYLGFASPDIEGLPRMVQRYLASLSAGSNLLWDLPSMDANLALRLARRDAADAVFEREVHGESLRAPGRRFMDAEAVRWIVAHEAKRPVRYAADFERVFLDEELRFFVLENPSARPRVQLAAGDSVRWVPDLAAAVSAFEGADPARERPELILEGQQADLPGEPSGGSFRAEIVSAEISDEHYDVVVEMSRAGWLVVADAPHPGWHARLDDLPAKVLPANLLSKAVAVPAGRHRVRLEFAPASFRVGAAVSGATALALVAFLLWKQRVWRRWVWRQGGPGAGRSAGTTPS